MADPKKVYVVTNVPDMMDWDREDLAINAEHGGTVYAKELLAMDKVIEEMEARWKENNDDEVKAGYAPKKFPKLKWKEHVWTKKLKEPEYDRHWTVRDPNDGSSWYIWERDLEDR